MAQLAPNRYALILADEPVTIRFVAREQLQSVAGRNYRQQIEARQQAVRNQLGQRNIRVTASASLLMNAVFVAATPDRVAEMAALPGVIAVVPQRVYKLSLNRATGLINGPGRVDALRRFPECG